MVDAFEVPSLWKLWDQSRKILIWQICSIYERKSSSCVQFWYIRYVLLKCSRRFDGLCHWEANRFFVFENVFISCNYETHFVCQCECLRFVVTNENFVMEKLLIFVERMFCQCECLVFNHTWTFCHWEALIITRDLLRHQCLSLRNFGFVRQSHLLLAKCPRSSIKYLMNAIVFFYFCHREAFAFSETVTCLHYH